MTKKGIVLIACIILVGIYLFWYSALKSNAKDLSGIYNGFLDIQTSIYDDIRDNSIWCGAFQIAREDFVNDVEMDSRANAFDNLNKENITEDQMSANNYYNKVGLFTLDLKSEIEKGVRDKFGEDIDVGNFTPEGSIVPQSSDYYEGKKEKKYGIFSKSKKIVDLKNMFERLDDGNFADVYDDIKYFGISCNSDRQHDQVEVLYYITDSDFAVSIKAPGGDEVILVRGTRGKTFMDIYKRARIKEQLYTESHKFTKYDCLKIPEINLNFKKDIYILKNQKFSDAEGNIYRIERAIQGIEIKLSNTFGTIKTNKLTDALPNINLAGDRYHYMYLDKPFTMFVEESGNELPYFAAQVSDIKLFQ